MASGKKSFFLGLFLCLGFVAIGFVAFATYKELNKKKQVQVEIEKLQQEAAKVSQENDLIQEKIAYLQSREYQEREAKDRLNLQSPDENVVIVKSSVVGKPSSDEKNVPPKEESASAPIYSAPMSNFKKWCNYFFN